jgi:hypothetical protein
VNAVPALNGQRLLSLRRNPAGSRRRPQSVRSSSAFLGVQSSTSSSSDLVKFTINLTVIRKSDWENARAVRSWLPAKPRANISYPVGVV